MQQTTSVTDYDSAAAADAGPYAYAPPAARGVVRPAPRPARTLGGWTWGSAWAFLSLNIAARALDGLSALTLLQSFAVVYGLGSVFWYWVGERPRQSFLSWTLKVVGLWLNLYVGFVAAPESLRGQMPEPLAYGLPAFVVLLVFYRAAPLKQDDGHRKAGPLWHGLLCAAALAALWGLFGPGAFK